MPLFGVAQPYHTCWSGDPPAAHGEPPNTAKGCPKKVGALREAHRGSGSWQERGAHAGALHQNYSLWEGPTLENVMQDCLLWERPHPGAGKEGEQEGVQVCDELTTAHIPCPSGLVGRRK